MIKNKDAYMKPFTFVVNNNMSKQVDRTFGDRVSRREVLEKNKIKYTIPYDGDLEWFINRYNIKGQLVEKIVKKSDGYYVQSEKGKNLGGPYKKKEDAERRLDQVEYFKNKDKKKVNEEKKINESYYAIMGRSLVRGLETPLRIGDDIILFSSREDAAKLLSEINSSRSNVNNFVSYRLTEFGEPSRYSKVFDSFDEYKTYEVQRKLDAEKIKQDNDVIIDNKLSEFANDLIVALEEDPEVNLVNTNISNKYADHNSPHDVSLARISSDLIIRAGVSTRSGYSYGQKEVKFYSWPRKGRFEVSEPGTSFGMTYTEGEEPRAIDSIMKWVHNMINSSKKDFKEDFSNKERTTYNESNDNRWKASYGDGREIIFVSKNYDDAVQYAASNSKGWDFDVKREKPKTNLSGEIIEIPETAEPIYTDMRMGVPMNFYKIDGVIYDNLGFRVSDEELKELGLKETFKRKSGKKLREGVHTVTNFDFDIQSWGTWVEIELEDGSSLRGDVHLNLNPRNHKTNIEGNYKWDDVENAIKQLLQQKYNYKVSSYKKVLDGEELEKSSIDFNANESLKENSSSNLSTIKKNAIEATKRDGYEQIVTVDKDGSYTIHRDYPSNKFDGRVVGRTKLNWKNGVKTAEFIPESLKEGLGRDYSNIPEVTEFNFVNKMHDKSGLLPGIIPMRGFIRTLEQMAAKVGPVFKIRKSRFGKYISDADIKDERGDIEKDYGWSITGDWDTSMSGYNEVWICKKLESLREGAEGKRELGFEYVIYEQPKDDHSSYAPIVAIRSTRTEAAYLASKLCNRSGFEKDYGYERVPKGKFHKGDDFWGPFDADYNKLESLKEDFSFATIRVFLDPKNENFHKDVKKLDSLCSRDPSLRGRLSFSDMYTIRVEADTQPGLKQSAKNVMWYIDRNIDSFVRYKNDFILDDIKNSVR